MAVIASINATTALLLEMQQSPALHDPFSLEPTGKGYGQRRVQPAGRVAPTAMLLLLEVAGQPHSPQSPFLTRS